MTAVDIGEVPYAVEFSAAVYNVEAVKRAAYQFSDRVAVEVAPVDGTIHCRLIPRSTTAAERLEQIAHDFRIEVLDQDLRLKIADETEPLRNLILSLAFSKTGLHE